MRIDCQSHVFPREYAEVLAQNPRFPKAIRQGDGYQVTYGEVQTFQLRLDAYALGRKLRDMDASGIDVSLLSVNMPGPERLVIELGVAGARACNDFIAEAVRKYPDRFAGLACLPWQDPPSAIEEMDRAVDDLGLRGIVLYSHIEGIPVDSPDLEPIYQHAEARNMPLVLHPTVPTWGNAVKDHSMIPMMALMVDHSFAMLRLILGGVLERYPRLKVVQPHCGGVLPYLWGRITYQTEVMGRGMERISEPPSAYYARVYLDMVSPSPLALRYAYDFAGPDHLLFGSDHPWVSIESFVQLIEAMEIPEEDKQRIFGSNAQGLFRIGR